MNIKEDTYSYSITMYMHFLFPPPLSPQVLTSFLTLPPIDPASHSLSLHSPSLPFTHPPPSPPINNICYCYLLYICHYHCSFQHHMPTLNNAGQPSYHSNGILPECIAHGQNSHLEGTLVRGHKSRWTLVEDT